MPVVNTIKIVSRFIVVIILAFALIIGGTGCFKKTPAAAVSIEEVEDGIFELVNKLRTASGLSVLVRSSHLDNLASEFVDYSLSNEWRQSSEVSYLLDNSWEVTHSGDTPYLIADTAGNQVDYCLEHQDMKDAIYRVEARETGIGIAVIGDTVYYTQVFDVLNLTGGDGQPIVLSENSQADDPTWEELKEFLEQDDTDLIAYQADVFICGDFAETLHNNAEEAGIRAAFVAVNFNDSPGHALNAFSIGDETVFIDVINGEKVAYIEVGKSYGVIALDIATDFSYSYFETYANLVEEHLQDREAYEADLEAYEDEAEDYNDGKPFPPEYDSRDDWRLSLEAQEEDLNNRYEDLQSEAETLGISGQYWDPTGL